MNTNIKRFLLVAAVTAAAAAALAQARRLNPRGGLPRRPAPAQQQPAAEEKPVADQLKDIPKGTNGVPILNFENAPLDLVLMQYATLSEKVLIPAPNLPKVQITLTSNGRELDKEAYLEAIEVALTMNGVVIEPFDKHFLRAFERKSVRTQGIRTLMNVSTNGIPEKGRVISQLIRLNHITAEEAQKAVEGFKDPNGLFQVFERTNAILVTDTQENVNRMLEIIKDLDVPNPVLEDVFERQIKYAKATEIKNYLVAIVTESQKDNQKEGAAPKPSGAPGFARSSAPQPNRLLNLNNRPGLNKPEPPPSTPNAVLTAAVSDADRGMIRGKVQITADDRSNKLIVITSKANWKFFEKVIDSLDVEITAQIDVQVIRLKYADAEDVEKMLNDLISGVSSSQSKSDKNQNQNVNKNAPTSRNVTQSAPPPAPVRRAASAQSSDNDNLGKIDKETTTVLADKRINSIIVSAKKEDMALIKKVIASMDISLSQVLIETVIIEVTLGDDLQTGIDWVQRGRSRQMTYDTDREGNKRYFVSRTDQDTGKTSLTSYRMSEAELNASGLDSSEYTLSELPSMIRKLTRDGLYNNGNYMLGGGAGSASSTLQDMLNLNGTTSSSGSATSSEGEAAAAEAASVLVNPIGGGVNYFLKSDKLNLAAVIQATKSDNRSKYLASPVIMTVDNKEATIDATSSRQFLTGWNAQSSSYAGAGMPSPQYSSKDIGVKLKVTPKINPDGTVMLKVSEEYNQVSERQTMKTPVGNTYRDDYIDVPSTRTMEADVILDNMQTVVFGGLTQTTTSETETGIPILKDIPWIGKWLFGSVKQEENRKELLVFMTPYVLSDANEAQAEALRRKRALSDPRAWDDHGWSLSPIADPVSKKEKLRRQALEWARQDEEHDTEKKLEEAKEQRVKDLEEKADKERREWARKHARDVLDALDRHEQGDVEWRELIDKLRKEKEAKSAAKEQEAQAAAKIRESTGEPAPAPEAEAAKKD